MAVGNKGGRPRKPTALHLLNGNPSKIPDLDAQAVAEPKPMEITPGAAGKTGDPGARSDPFWPAASGAPQETT